jgi:hypothetical protein
MQTSFRFNFSALAVICILAGMLAACDQSTDKRMTFADQNLVELVTQRFTDNGIPFEVQGNSIVYSEKYIELAEELALEAISSVGMIIVHNPKTAEDFINRLKVAGITPYVTWDADGAAEISFPKEFSDQAEGILTEAIRAK